MGRRSPRVALRRADALRMRAGGKSYEDITAELGYSTVDVCRKDVSRGMRQAVVTAASEQLQTEVTRLDALTAALWDKAMAGDHQAVNSLTRVCELRARLLRLGDVSTEAQKNNSREAAQGIAAKLQLTMEAAASQLD